MRAYICAARALALQFVAPLLLCFPVSCGSCFRFLWLVVFSFLFGVGGASEDNTPLPGCLSSFTWATCHGVQVCRGFMQHRMHQELQHTQTKQHQHRSSTSLKNITIYCFPPTTGVDELRSLFGQYGEVEVSLMSALAAPGGQSLGLVSTVRSDCFLAGSVLRPWQRLTNQQDGCC